MRFGSFLELPRPEGATSTQAYEQTFAHVDMAEELGLDTICLAEFHFTPNRVISSPLMLGSAIAGRTKRIRVATSVLVLPLTNPLRVAEETATLDNISSGRFEFGVGRSGFQVAYDGYGIPYTESRDRFSEALEVIVKAWTHEKFSYDGQFYTYNDVCLVPKPIQSPHPIIRIAATSNDTFPVNGRMGYPLLVGLRTVPLAQVTTQVSSYKTAYKEAEHAAPMDVSLRVPVYIAETKEAAINEPETSFMRQTARLRSQLTRPTSELSAADEKSRGERAKSLASITWDDIRREKVIVGTPEMVIEQLKELQEALHLTEVVAEFNAGEQIPPERIERSLQLFCEKVMPAFK